MKKSKINKFIEKAKSIHGDKYNYEKVNYVNTPYQFIVENIYNFIK